MHVKLKSDGELKEALKEYISATSAFEYGNTSLSFETPGAAGKIKEVYFTPDLVVSLIDVETRDLFRFQTRMVVSDMVEAGFTLEGQVQFSMKGVRQNFDIYPGQGALTVARGEMESELCIAPGQRVRLAEVRFTAESFDNYSALADWVMPAPLSTSLTSSGCIEGSRKCACLMTPKMRLLIESLLRRGFSDSDIPDDMEDLCISCTGELISYLRNGMGNTKTILSSADLERIREARNIMFRRMENPPGIPDLARMVGLNDYKLKTGFRQAFGSTVHRSLTEMRLKKAYELIKVHDFTVTEAAMRVGYHNLGDFGILFKHRYGKSPRDIRSRRKIVNLAGS